MTPKPYLFCDLDGVLNVFSALQPNHPFHEHSNIRGYRITRDIRHPEMVAELERNFTVLWSTLWESDAPDYVSPFLGFGHTWPVLRFQRFNAARRLNRNPRNGVMDYKMPHIIDTAGPVPFVVLDDDIEHTHRRLGAQLTEAGFPALFIGPDPEFGLQREHVDLALAFARKVREGRHSAPQMTS